MLCGERLSELSYFALLVVVFMIMIELELENLRVWMSLRVLWSVNVLCIAMLKR